MRWTPRGRSRNIEDRRGVRGMGASMGAGGVVLLLVLGLLFGRDFISETGGTNGSYVSEGGLAPEDSAREEPMVQFVSFVLDDAQSTWQRIFAESNQQYRDARLVLFRDATQSACGVGQSAMGPFYCPLDERVYLDLGFFDELHQRFGAPGDFAQAYVITHEIGHHVQNVLGTNARVRELQDRNPGQANELSVRLELQADCYAGVWGNATAQRDVLERGDIDEGLGAAAAIGDDRIQRETQGRISPESFTHGTSAQRVAWFRRGLESGDPRTCDTFSGSI